MLSATRACLGSSGRFKLWARNRLSRTQVKPEPRPKRQPVGKAPALLTASARIVTTKPVTKTAPVPLALSRLGAISGLAAHEVGL